MLLHVPSQWAAGGDIALPQLDRFVASLATHHGHPMPADLLISNAISFGGSPLLRLLELIPDILLDTMKSKAEYSLEDHNSPQSLVAAVDNFQALVQRHRALIGQQKQQQQQQQNILKRADEPSTTPSAASPTVTPSKRARITVASDIQVRGPAPSWASSLSSQLDVQRQANARYEAMLAEAMQL